MYNEELEKAMLAYIINGNTTFILSEKDFVNSAHKKIINAINKLITQKKEITILTVRDELKTNSVKALEYLANLTDFIYGTSAETVYNELKELTKKREMFNLSKKIQLELANQDNADIYIEKCIKELQVIESQTQKEDEFVNQIVKTIERIQTRVTNKENHDYFTGFFDLDNMTDGLHKGELTIIGARPAVGKTTFSLQIAENIASKGKYVYFVSMEMSAEQMIEKIIARKARINSNLLRQGELEERDILRINEECEEISKLNFNIGVNINTIQQIEVRARKLKNKNQLDLLCVDYLQLVKSQGSFGSREQEVADISRTLKSLALELNIPIIALCQLNRNASRNEPTLADIRESGAIEQDADNVIFLYKKKDDSNIITVDLQKQREGRTGVLELKFNKSNSEFVNLIK